jgi:hypothetical protein
MVILAIVEEDLFFVGQSGKCDRKRKGCLKQGVKCSKMILIIQVCIWYLIEGA